MNTPSILRPSATTVLRLVVAGLLLVTWAALPRASASAPAAVNWYVAVTGNDSNPCTTPQQPCQHIQIAIDRAASGDIINITAGTYIEQLTITDRNLTLNGESASTTFLDGNDLYQVLSIQRESLPTMTVNIANVTIQRGQSDQPGGGIATEDNIYLTLTNSNILSNTASFGGGIFNQGILKLTNVILRSNNASTTGTSEGGAMWNTGFADLINVTVSNNEAQRGGGISTINVITLTNSLVADNKTIGEYGGGIYNRSVNGRTTLVNSVVSGNRAIGTDGGGIYNEGILISSGSLISGNLALVSGGGIYNKASAHLTLNDVTFQANHSINTGGALFNNGTATLTDLTVRNNLADDTGGGLYNSDAGRLYLENSNVLSNTTAAARGGGIGNLGVLTVTRSSLLYNNAATSLQGGGLYNANTAQLTNATISNNTAAAGGAVHNISGTLTIQFSTISYNSAPALNRAGGNVTVSNSLLVQSTGAACSGSITSANYNVDSGNTCGFAQSNDLINTDPQLGPLRDNGGNSLTRAIGFGSPAQDTAVVPCPLTIDQRGIARPQFDICDRGAYEIAGYSNPSPIDIGAGQCITSLLPIGDQFAVGRLLTGVNLTYGNRGSLTVRLLAPNYRSAYLLGPAANSGQDLDTLFDDSAAQIVPAGNQNIASPFYEYVYRPTKPLQRFNGVSINGTWRLEVCNAGAASGSLNRWVLVVPEISEFNVFMPVIRRR